MRKVSSASEVPYDQYKTKQVSLERKWIWMVGIVALLLASSGFWFYPRVRAVFHQAQGGRYLNQLLETTGGDNSVTVYCLSSRLEEDEQQIAQKSRGHLERAIEFKSNYSRTYLQLGRVNCLLGDYNAAIESYSHYTDLRPDNPLGYIELALAYEGDCHQKYNHSPALNPLSPQGHLCPNTKTQDAMVEAWRASEVPVQHLINTGEEALEASEFEDALNWSGRANWINPKWWKPWYLAGEVYREQEAWESARQAILIAWDQKPVQTTTALAEILQVQGDQQALEDVLKQSLTNAPDAVDRLIWWTMLGETLNDQKRLGEAVEVYQNAIEEYPGEITFYLGLGWAIYYRSGDVQPVQDLFTKAVQLKPQNGTGYFAMGEILAKEERYTEADPWFEKAIERNPDIRWWHIIRGNTARDGGNLSLAIEIYEHALGLFTDFGQLYYEIAWAYYLNDQHTAAIRAIDDALRVIDPPNKWYYLRAGAIYEAGGDLEDALAAYHQVLVLEPDNDSASAGVERLEKELDLQNP